MASKLSIIFTINCLLLTLFSPSSGSFLTSNSGSPQTFCNSTPYPYFCRSILRHNKPGTVYDYGRLSLRESLSYAKHFLSLVRRLLRLPLNLPAIRALEDCQFLTQLNINSLSYALGTVNDTDHLQSLEASDVQTLLSATLTNMDTCLDGLRSSEPFSNIANSLMSPLYNGTKHYSISLALFSHGWLPRKKKGRVLMTERKYIFSDLKNGVDDGLPLRMSHQDRKIYESLSRRKLLQITPGSTNVTVSKMVVVDRKGSGNFTTINDAVATAPNNTGNTGQYFVIYIVNGQYNEYVSIPVNKQNVMMIGDGIGRTVITGNRSVGDNFTTFNSATFAVVGQGFVAVNISFRNTAGAIKHQAVAVRNGADMSAFYKCGFEGYQDTLYAHSLRQFYRDCEIYGTIDYIFGNAAAVFQNCRIMSRLPMTNQFNVITAQGRSDPNQNTGYSIQNCSIKEAKDLAESNGTTKTYLGRPWREYSRTVFMQSYIASLIDPAGWIRWSDNSSVANLYYAEFNNSGIGSRTGGRVNWPGFHLINATDAVNFTVTNLIQGGSWLAAVGVPYTAGLM